MRNLFIGFMVMFLCAACTKQGGTEELPSKRYEVDVLFSPSGLGDSGYNDIILYGIQQTQMKHGYSLTMHLTDSVEKGWSIYQQWLVEEVGDDVERMMIFAGNDYEALLRQSPPEVMEGSKVVLFETDSLIPNVYTFSLETYGAAYCIGKMASEIAYSAAVLAANPEDRNLKHCIDGFRDGYSGGDPMNDIAVCYLAERMGMGYDMADRAYQLSYELYQWHSFVFPIAGRSNMGVWRYLREYPGRVYSAGIDGDMSKFSYQIIASLVKRLDLAIEEFIAAWINDGVLTDENVRYGLDTEFVDVAVSEEYKDFFAPLADGLEQEAIEREREYVYGK